MRLRNRAERARAYRLRAGEVDDRLDAVPNGRPKAGMVLAVIRVGMAFAEAVVVLMLPIGAVVDVHVVAAVLAVAVCDGPGCGRVLVLCCGAVVVAARCVWVAAMIQVYPPSDVVNMGVPIQLAMVVAAGNVGVTAAADWCVMGVVARRAVMVAARCVWVTAMIQVHKPGDVVSVGMVTRRAVMVAERDIGVAAAADRRVMGVVARRAVVVAARCVWVTAMIQVHEPGDVVSVGMVTRRAVMVAERDIGVAAAADRRVMGVVARRAVVVAAGGVGVADDVSGVRVVAVCALQVMGHRCCAAGCQYRRQRCVPVADQVHEIAAEQVVHGPDMTSGPRVAADPLAVAHVLVLAVLAMRPGAWVARHVRRMRVVAGF